MSDVQITDPSNNETYALDSKFIEAWRSGARFALTVLASDPSVFVSTRMHEKTIKAISEACVEERDRMIAALAENVTARIKSSFNFSAHRRGLNGTNGNGNGKNVSPAFQQEQAQAAHDKAQENLGTSESQGAEQPRQSQE